VRIAFFQFCPTLHDKTDNLRRIRQALAHVEADLLVLPEMCTTGYLFPSKEALAAAAEPVPGPSTDALLKLSRERNTAIVFGLPERAGDRVFNSAALVTPQGDCHVYRKAHLFLDEKDLFAPGDLPFPVFEYAGTKVGMLVCFDHFFPEAARCLALKGAQVICHCANLVLDVAQTTTRSRAIENRVYWILANRTGFETLGKSTLHFTGASQVVAPDGAILCHASADADEVCIVEIDPVRALDKHATPRNDLFQDRRTDLYPPTLR
jgi:predicted amidohydrolase